jgi:hypothetical protein
LPGELQAEEEAKVDVNRQHRTGIVIKIDLIFASIIYNFDLKDR